MKEKYLKWRDGVGFDRVKKYLNWVSGEYPGMDLHHLFGSIGSIKTSDYLIAPINHQHHLGIVEKNKSEWAFLYIDYSIRILKRYCIEKFIIIAISIHLTK